MMVIVNEFSARDCQGFCGFGRVELVFSFCLCWSWGLARGSRFIMA